MGLPFFRFLNTNDPAIYPIGCLRPTPYPDGFPANLTEQFNVVFGDRLTCYDYPQSWLAEWWAFLRRNVARWEALLESANLLTAENALNTDMRTYEREENEEQGVTGSASSELTSETTNDAKKYIADVPDDQVPNVADYYSIGAGGVTTNTSTDGGTQSTTRNTAGKKTVTEKYEGRAGKNPSSLVTSYRTAISYNAWDQIFKECEKMFIGVYEGGDYYGYYYD